MPKRPPTIGPAEPIERSRPAQGVAPTESASAVDGPAAVTAKSAIEAAQAPQAVSLVSAVGAASGADRVGSIADRLRRGMLSPSQAVEELIEDAVRRNLPGMAMDSRLSQELRAMLLSYAKDDPYLTSRISRLGILR